MKILLEHIYAEINSIAENISYLKGRCDSIIEICTVNRFINKTKKYKTQEEKELYKIEEILRSIKDDLNSFSERIPKQIKLHTQHYEKQILNKKSKIVSTMLGN